MQRRSALSRIADLNVERSERQLRDIHRASHAATQLPKTSRLLQMQNSRGCKLATLSKLFSTDCTRFCRFGFAEVSQN